MSERLLPGGVRDNALVLIELSFDVSTVLGNDEFAELMHQRGFAYACVAAYQQQFRTTLCNALEDSKNLCCLSLRDINFLGILHGFDKMVHSLLTRLYPSTCLQLIVTALQIIIQTACGLVAVLGVLGQQIENNT